MGLITTSELVDKANGYKYGIAEFQLGKEAGGIGTSIAFNEAIQTDESIIFQQANQDDVKVTFNKDDIALVEDMSEEECGICAVILKNGITIKIFLFNEKGSEPQACHFLYGSYDDFLKVLDLNSLQGKVNKAKKAFVSVSDGSTYLHHTYNNVCLESVDDAEESYRLVFFNGDNDERTDRLSFTLYGDALNDIWLMGGADGWEGLKLRLYGQPFAEIRISLLYK